MTRTGGIIIRLAARARREAEERRKARLAGLPTPQAPARYTLTAKLLHWLVAGCVIVLLALGFAMKRLGLPLELKFSLYQLHKSLGLVVLALMVMRVVWRMRHRPPPLPESMPFIERFAAHATHLFLYALLLAMPVTGWLLVSSATFAVPTKLFGTLAIPHLPVLAELTVAERRPLEAFFKLLHLLTGLAILALVVLHIAAAIRHRLSRKDDVLARMLPWRGGPAGAVALMCLAGFYAVAQPAVAASEAPLWRLDAAKSTLAFKVEAGGQTITGRFGGFTTEIRLDPQNPAGASVRATIATATARTGNPDVDQALADEAWFDSTRHPEARLVADRIARQPDGTYVLTGTLTLKGRTLPVTLPFTLAVTGTRAVATGRLSLDRLAYGVGPDAPIAGLVIARAVEVSMHLECDRL